MRELSELSDRVGGLVRRIRACVVALEGTRGKGAGVVVAPGVIISAAHVVGERGTCRIEGQRRHGMVVATRLDCDLALISAPLLDRPAMPMAARVRVGELVVAVGSGLGVEGLSTIGIVSGFAPVYRVGAITVHDVITADVPSAPGNSGGALANARGELTGIVVGGTRDGNLTVSIGGNRVAELLRSTRPVLSAWRHV